MKNRINFILLFFIGVIFLSCLGTFAQGIAGTNPHDSLLFDGSGTSFIRDAGEKCRVKVVGPIGKVIGTYYKDSVGEVCGVKDTIQVIRTGQLHNGYWLVPGTEVTLGPYDDVTNENSNVASLVWGDNNSIFLFAQAFVTKVLIGKDCTMHVITGNVSVSGGVDIVSNRSKITHKQTHYTIEAAQTDGKFTDVIRVYEGSVELRNNNDNPDYKQSSKKHNDELKEETKKLTDDFKNGKLTADEFKQRMDEIQKKLKATTDDAKIVTIEAGYSSSITDTDAPTDPVPFDVNANRWWDK